MTTACEAAEPNSTSDGSGVSVEDVAFDSLSSTSVELGNKGSESVMKVFSSVMLLSAFEVEVDERRGAIMEMVDTVP